MSRKYRFYNPFVRPRMSELGVRRENAILFLACTPFATVATVVLDGGDIIARRS
jgi:hypothetical protein